MSEPAICTLLSLGLVAGVLAQIVLGGITVLVDLHPVAVQGHMVLSLILVATQSCSSTVPWSPTRGWRSARCLRRSAVTPLGSPVSTALALVTGTVVTGAGPLCRRRGRPPFRCRDRRSCSTAWHDRRARRGGDVCPRLAPAAAAGRAGRARRLDVGVHLVALLQGAIGYIQYFSEVPALLVGIHAFGATVLWAITVTMVVRTLPARRSAPVPDGARPPLPHRR